VREHIASDNCQPDAVQMWADNQGTDILTEDDWADNMDEFLDAYLGEWDSETEWAQEQACELGLGDYNGNVMPPEMVANFVSWIDWDQIVYDYQCSGEFWWERTADNSGVYVFRAV
jgi:hypothetical protein